jgi:hypothetical protein
VEGKIELRTPAGKSVDVAAGRMAVAMPGAMPVVRALPKEETLVGLDFEDGKKSALVTMGAVEKGPDRPGNRFVLAGIPDPSGVSRLFIAEDVLGLFTFQGDEVLSFDYWADSLSAQVNFNFYSRSRQLSFQGFVPKPVFGKWAHASIRLADLGTPESRLHEEDWVVHLYMQATGAATKRFYVDNVQITRPRVLKPRPSEPKKAADSLLRIPCRSTSRRGGERWTFSCFSECWDSHRRPPAAATIPRSERSFPPIARSATAATSPRGISASTSWRRETGGRPFSNSSSREPCLPRESPVRSRPS